MSIDPRGTVISTILRHDAKTTSYKIALIRAINDVALAFPDVAGETAVAIPLTMLAEFWLAYYWPFVDQSLPIWQGPRNRRREGVAQDMAFRQELTSLKLAWERMWQVPSAPSDGFVVVNEMRVVRRRAQYPASFAEAYQGTLHAIANTIEMPIHYAGPGKVYRLLTDRPGNRRPLTWERNQGICSCSKGTASRARGRPSASRLAFRMTLIILCRCRSTRLTNCGTSRRATHSSTNTPSVIVCHRQSGWSLLSPFWRRLTDPMRWCPH